MANSLNVTTLLGLVGRNPDYLPADSEKQSMATFSLGVEHYSKKNRKTEIDWFNVKVFGNLADYVNRYVRKNRKFGATGRLQNNKWNKDDGTVQYKVELVADKIVPCDDKIPEYDDFNNTVKTGSISYNND